MNYSRFLQYAHWSNLRTLEMLSATPAVDSTALAIFSHLLASEQLWLKRLRGQEPDMSHWPELGVLECERIIEMNFAGYKDFLTNLSSIGLTSEIEYQTTKGVKYKTAISDILMQVFSHGSYHRGQIIARLQRVGARILETDYITFIRESH